LSKSLPEKRCNVHMAWADLCASLDKLEVAKCHARAAVKAAEQINFVALKAQATAQLNNLLAGGPNAGPQSPAPDGLGATERVTGILALAHQALLAGNLENALGLTNQALEESVTSSLRRDALLKRVAVFFELAQLHAEVRLDRLGEAETDLDECISLLSVELASDTEVATGALDSRIIDEENFYLLKAFVRAKAGQSTEAWDFAEEGRSGRLKRQIKAAKRLPNASLEDTTFAKTHDWLQSKRAAILSFAATKWGTLALTAGPDDEKPDAQILDKFSSGELNRLLVPDAIGADDDVILSSEVVKKLSAGLIQPLGKRLRAITQSAKVLYIIPDSVLYYAPFAALTLETSLDSPTLVDLCPLAYTPSTAILFWSADDRARASSRECLAVAVGRDTTGFEFHDHLPQIAKASWPTPPVELRDEAATVERVTAQAPRYPVLYFSCHGTASGASGKLRDPMAASQLELAGEKPFLSARDVAEWKLCANLVFLNACQSGRFRQKARSDVNGFVRAFLLAGAASLIAPLIHVEPRAAGDFAEEFFRAWVAGASASEALRAAQFAARQKDPQSKQWATYCLTGDFRSKLLNQKPTNYLS